MQKLDRVSLDRIELDEYVGSGWKLLFTKAIIASFFLASEKGLLVIGIKLLARNTSLADMHICCLIIE